MDSDDQRVASCEDSSPARSDEECLLLLEETDSSTESSVVEGRKPPPRWYSGWPIGQRTTLLCGAGLLGCGALGMCSVYVFSRQHPPAADRFLLYNPPPPGERWSQLADTLLFKAAAFGGRIANNSQPALDALGEGFGLLESVVDHSLLFLYAQTFSLTCILGPFALIYIARTGWCKVTGRRGEKREAIASVQVTSSKSTENSSRSEVTVTAKVNKGRLLRRLPSLLLHQSVSSVSDVEADRDRQLDPLTTARKPVLALALAGFAAAPFHWFSTYLFFVSVRSGWSNSDTFCRVWCWHTGLVVAGMVAFELGCGGVERIFTPDSYYRNTE